jgi:signal transduction histidine kinase/CheY-like chemotaxis protein/ligand-binding sensor domain-containing protein/AraC-like DNA-binding protein
MKLRILTLVFLLSTSVSYTINTKFYSINTMFGISVRETYSICSDNNGFIWVSSKTGILRLTENDYRLYPIPYQMAVISSKLLYKNNLLFVYANDGQVFGYNPIRDRFVLLMHIGELLKNKFLYVHTIQVDDQGTFWIATSSGLYKYQNQKLSLAGSQNIDVKDITWYDNTHLIVGNTSQVYMLNTCNSKEDLLFRFSKSLNLSKFYFDRAQRKIWIGTVSSGLFSYDLNKQTLSQFSADVFPKQPILAMTVNSDSTLMIGVDGQGIWKIHRGKKDCVIDVFKEDIDDFYSLRGDGVYDIFCDQNKRVWTATFSGGISFFDQTSSGITQISHAINNTNSLCNNYINKIVEDSKGNIWFATNNGIAKWDVKKNRWVTYYHNNQKQAQVFLSLCEDDRGNIWAGTYASGVYVIDENSGHEIAHYDQNAANSPISNNFIQDIYKDSQGDLWMGGAGGNIVCYLVKGEKFLTYQGQPLTSFVEYSPGKLLLSCSYGLCLLDKKTGNETILQQDFLPLNIVVSDEKAWIATRGDGLIVCDLKSMQKRKFTITSGLPSNFINGIVKIDGYLWLATETGLCKFNLNDYSVITYSSLLPLYRASFNRNAQCRLKNGNLILGTNNGAIMFQPDVIKNIASKVKLYLQDLTISGVSVKENPGINLKIPLDSLKEIKLYYNQNTFTLELLPLGMNTSDLKFSWQLKGFDQDWSHPSNQKIITYTNLSSGNYILKIRLYDNSMTHAIAERSVDIRIIPPVWARWWFVSFLFLLVAGIVYLSVRYYINRLKQIHAEDKVRFFANTAHEIRTSLTLINAPIEELNKEESISATGKYYVRLATEQSKRLSQIVTSIMDFQKIDVGKEKIVFRTTDIVNMVSFQKMMFESYAQTKNIELIFYSNVSAYVSGVDEIIMEKVIGNLISNAIKYSHPNSQIQLNLNCYPEFWTLEVIDHGIGMSEKAQRNLFNEFYRGENAINSMIIGSGIGLLIAKKHVKLHGGVISCTSRENIGSCFCIKIPYKEVKDDNVLLQVFSNQTEPVGTKSDLISEPLEPTSDKQLKKMRLLIAEDNTDLQNFLTHALREEFEVDTAEDGRIAWELVQKEMPDLVVSDIIMPNMDGFELCRLIKSTYQTAHIPVVLLTALSEQTEQLHGLGLGADDYLTKPFNVTLLLQRIKSIIQNRLIIREKALKLIDGDNNTPILINENNDKFVKHAVAVVHEHIEETGFGKEEFAFAMNVSSSLLYKKLKSLTNQSPNEFIKCIRLNYAIELLKSRKYSVTEISELAGFASVGYFSTVFKKYFGKLPTEVIDI